MNPVSNLAGVGVKVVVLQEVCDRDKGVKDIGNGIEMIERKLASLDLAEKRNAKQPGTDEYRDRVKKCIYEYMRYINGLVIEVLAEHFNSEDRDQCKRDCRKLVRGLCNLKLMGQVLQLSVDREGDLEELSKYHLNQCLGLEKGKEKDQLAEALEVKGLLFIGLQKSGLEQKELNLQNRVFIIKSVKEIVIEIINSSLRHALFQMGIERLMLYSTVYLVQVKEGKSDKYSRVFAEKVAAKKSEVYARAYAVEIEAGKSEAFAHLSAALSVTAPAYRMFKAYGKGIIAGA